MSIALRKRLIEAAQAMQERGLGSGTAGNLSVREADGLLITPSGMAYGHLAVEDIAFVDGDREAHGPHPPSSEWRIHHDIYTARAEVGAVLHAHPPYATALACLHFDIPDFHYEVAFAGGDSIRCAQYATFGSQALSDHVLKALQDRRAALMANHGMISLGHDLAAALALAEKVEALARVYCICLGIREPQLLGETEMRRVLERFRDYRPPGR